MVVGFFILIFTLIIKTLLVMNSITTKLEIDGWKLMVNFETIIIQKNGEHRIYDINYIVEVKTEKEYPEYIYLHRVDGSYYQVKFDENN